VISNFLNIFPIAIHLYFCSLENVTSDHFQQCRY